MENTGVGSNAMGRLTLTTICAVCGEDVAIVSANGVLRAYRCAKCDKAVHARGHKEGAESMAGALEDHRPPGFWFRCHCGEWVGANCVTGSRESKVYFPSVSLSPWNGLEGSSQIRECQSCHDKREAGRVEWACGNCGFYTNVMPDRPHGYTAEHHCHGTDGGVCEDWEQKGDQ